MKTPPDPFVLCPRDPTPEMCNERLEFLGDSVLSVVVSDFLYKSFPKLPEGKLTRIRASAVCEKALSEFSEEAGTRRTSAAFPRGGAHRRTRPLEHYCRRLRGAYRRNLSRRRNGACERICAFLWCPLSTSISAPWRRISRPICRRSFSIIPRTSSYTLVGEQGPDHDKRFTVEVRINSNLVGTGTGHSKKDAEQAAAEQALKLMGIIK